MYDNIRYYYYLPLKIDQDECALFMKTFIVSLPHKDYFKYFKSIFSISVVFM